MISLQTKLEAFGSGLAAAVEGAAGGDCYHYFRPQLDPPFAVWAEDGEDNSLNADNKKAEQEIHGTTDYYTKTEYDPVVDVIQEYFNGLDHFGWRLLNVNYDDETNTIHFEWEWWII